MKPKSTGPLRLTDANEKHLGFILMAGDGCPLDVDSFEGDCVFMPLPQDPAVFDQRPFLLLADHKDAGEHRYKFTKKGATLHFEISGPLNALIWVIVDDNGWGTWGTRVGDREEQLGFSHRVNADKQE